MKPIKRWVVRNLKSPVDEVFISHASSNISRFGETWCGRSGWTKMSLDEFITIFGYEPKKHSKTPLYLGGCARRDKRAKKAAKEPEVGRMIILEE